MLPSGTEFALLPLVSLKLSSAPTSLTLPLLLAFQAKLASGFSLLVFPLVYFHEEMAVFINPPLCFLYVLQLISSPV